jgi:hypothetical protein
MQRHLIFRPAGEFRQAAMALLAAAGAGNPLEVNHPLAGLGVGDDFGQLTHAPGAAIGAVAVEESNFQFVENHVVMRR